jgi:hypothetical protein
VTGQEAGKLRRVGSLERDKPSLLARKTLKWGQSAVYVWLENRKRGGSTKVESFQQERKPWRAERPGELGAGFQSKPLSRVANSRVE